MSDVGVIVCGHVFREARDVKLVIRHADGGLQLACGLYDHPADVSDFEVVHFHHLLERQPDLVIADRLVPGELAEWENGDWLRRRHDD